MILYIIHFFTSYERWKTKNRMDSTQEPKPTILWFDIFLQQQDFFVQEIKNNKICIFPTDTLYWISALFSKDNIQKINAIKQSNSYKKLSILAPSFSWIDEHFVVTDPAYLKICFEKYHGVTYILWPKETSPYYTFFQEWFEDPSIGVRILKHPLQDFVKELWEPIISTSVNISGEANHTTIDTLSEELTKQIDYIIDQWEIFGKPSVLIFVDEKRIVER